MPARTGPRRGHVPGAAVLVLLAWLGASAPAGSFALSASGSGGEPGPRPDQSTLTRHHDKPPEDDGKFGTPGEHGGGVCGGVRTWRIDITSFPTKELVAGFPAAAGWPSLRTYRLCHATHAAWTQRCCTSSRNRRGPTPTPPDVPPSRPPGGGRRLQQAGYGEYTSQWAVSATYSSLAQNAGGLLGPSDFNNSRCVDVKSNSADLPLVWVSGNNGAGTDTLDIRFASAFYVRRFEVYEVLGEAIGAYSYSPHHQSSHAGQTSSTAAAWARAAHLVGPCWRVRVHSV